MRRYWEHSIEGITALEVTITGSWDAALTAGSLALGMVWSGRAAATEPVVAIQAARTPRYLQGVKSAKYDTAGVEYATLPLAVTLHPAGRPADPQGGSGQFLTLAVTRLANASSVGGWTRRPACLIPQFQALSRPIHSQTGRWTPLIQAPGVRLDVIFFARRDVRYARKAIWNLRPGIRERLNTHGFAPLFASRRTQTILFRDEDAGDGQDWDVKP